ncbi:ADP-dependent glucokinase/phosphofructokinase [Candidatus Nanosalina sp. VS9-1]|uniref:ADP-dependent glucokinase/phosphofructokinase n=1 Tax=Candidatus Nanosalina sp. VS9-1 TaxID=3388566 RepID=UPI0039E1E988
MKDIWRRRYLESVESERSEANVLTGFNANLDYIYRFDDLDIDLESVESRKIDPVKNPEELNSVLKYCIENNENMEVHGKHLAREFPEAEKRLGGQGGIISDFLSKTGNYVVFYTPFLSQELADLIDSEVVYPVADGGLKLKRVKDAVNTDRVKENMIVEYDNEHTGRLIVSDRLQGFGPYFRKGVEEKLDKLDDELDAVVLSGFHDADGNFESKIDKAEVQISQIKSPKHLEYVDMEASKSEKILADLVPEFDSIGLDESEALELSSSLGHSFEEKLSLGEAFQLSKSLIEDYSLERIHIHTYRYHVAVTGEDYGTRPEKIRESMLYAENCALKMSDIGEIPDSIDMNNYSLENKHVHILDDLEDFQHHLGLDNFVEEGIAEIDGFNVVSIPTLIHEDPERVVGMGDVISSAAFTAELR